jgi:RNA polymerase sigma-70 factor (ECF subfamily)
VGPPPSFEQLIEGSVSRIHRAALGFLGDEQSAREAAQEALTRAYAARGRYDPGRPFYPWMYRIVKNTCLDILRSRRRRPQAAVEVERLAASGPSPLEEVSAAQLQRRLWRAMSQLQDDHQEILNLRHFQDLSYAEISALLDIAEGTVMSRLYRARRALAASMKEGA